MSLKRTSTPTVPFASAAPISGGGGQPGALEAVAAAAPPGDLDVSIIAASQPSSVSGSLSHSGTTAGNLSTSGNISGGGQRMEGGGSLVSRIKFG